MRADWLLATDMDGTVLPLDDAPERAAAIADFGAACAGRRNLALVYVTGRHLALALDGIQRYGLPLPDALGCDVGTSLYWRDGDHWRQDEGYRVLMQEHLDGASLADVARILDDLPGFRLQEDERQTEFKRSYYTRVQQATPESAAEIQIRLHETGAAVQVVTSVDPVRECGLLDVLPTGAGKATGLAFLQQKLGIPADHCLFAGDSGNDLAALLSGCLAVVVGNAADEVKSTLREQVAARSCQEQVHFATGFYAAGVLEGARHFGLFESRDQEIP